MNKRTRWGGSNRRLIVGLLGVLALSGGGGLAQSAAESWKDGPHQAPSSADREEPPREVGIEFGGDRLERFEFAPVYRRYEQLSLTIEPPTDVERREMRVDLERVGPGGAVESHQSLRKTRKTEATRVRLPLRSAHGVAAVGEYRIVVRASENEQRLGSRSFYVIFNATDRADHRVYHPEADAYLGSELEIQQQRNGEPYRFKWSVEPRDPAVFRRAMRAVTGARSPAAAVRRLVAAAARRVEGYWPELDDVRGEVPRTSPEADVNWSPASVRSVVERLERRHRRGQCFDYTALLVAFARSVGLPATAVSAFDPEPLPHPYDGSRRVDWDYHVWPEVFFRERWWGVDITYLDADLPVAEQADRVLRNPAPALQPRWGPWFKRIVGPGTRLWSDRREGLKEITPDYRKNVGGRARRVDR